MGVSVAVGGAIVSVEVGVMVIVAVGVMVGGMTSSGLLRIAKKTITAPMPRKIASKPIAAGRLREIMGMRLP